jgi:hypothetical protein
MAALMLAWQHDMAHRREFAVKELSGIDSMHPLDMYNDVELYQRYRFDRHTILDLIDAVRDDLE